MGYKKTGRTSANLNMTLEAFSFCLEKVYLTLHCALCSIRGIR